jgi:hypothetical protein
MLRSISKACLAIRCEASDCETMPLCSFDTVSGIMVSVKSNPR